MVSRETAVPEPPEAAGPAGLAGTRGGVTGAVCRAAGGPGYRAGPAGPTGGSTDLGPTYPELRGGGRPEAGLIPADAQVADIGSGAGLPGIVWAIARPDITVVLIESLLRRVTFLTECVHELNLTDRVQVVRARAEEAGDRVGAADGGLDVVTARAVAPLGTVAAWSAPLIRPGGLLVALKGESAQEEVDRDADQLRASGLVDAEVLTVGQGVVEPPTTVVTARRAAAQ
jgi:16S rRNA (guanine(527)-N(7))-methyltransferase RsmG